MNWFTGTWTNWILKGVWMPEMADPASPMVVWWWDRSVVVDPPPVHLIRWVEITGDGEGRSGSVRVSKRTSDPSQFDDAAVVAELHHELERRLAMTIRVDHATRRLGVLRVDRRIAVTGGRIRYVSMHGYDMSVLGGVAVQDDLQRHSYDVIVRDDLGPTLRDQVLLWAEELMADLPAVDEFDPDAAGWQRTARGWQRLARYSHPT